MSLHDHPDEPEQADVVGVRGYIADMLCELAKLAAEHDEGELALAIHHAALLACISKPPTLRH